MVLFTLDRMARGGIRDQLGGGYHRYATSRYWIVPHFEKMLYDNAQLASVHLLAYEITRDPRWKDEAEARVLRSVLMKPEHEAWVGTLHEEVVRIARRLPA